MLRLSLALAAIAAAALTLAPAALSARVSIRVEGKTQTIYGRAPRGVEAANALEALQLAAVAGEFYVHVAAASFGPYVDQIGRYAAGGLSGWVYKVNGASPPVGADQAALRDGDTVLWYWADFDGTTFAGPKTLVLETTSRRCYASFAQDDNGARQPAGDVRIWIGGVPTRADADGRFCLGRHVGLVRVTADGAVRSNALP